MTLTACIGIGLYLLLNGTDSVPERNADIFPPDEVTCIAVQNDSLIAAVASHSLICTSTDGKEWEMMDFNSTYSEYYGWIFLTGLAASDYDFMVLGQDEGGLPVAFTSVQGRVWSPRSLEYPGSGGFERLKETPDSLLYDGEHDRYEILLKNGDRLLLPSCSHCNVLVKGQR